MRDFLLGKLGQLFYWGKLHLLPPVLHYFVKFLGCGCLIDLCYQGFLVLWVAVVEYFQVIVLEDFQHFLWGRLH